MKNAYILFCLFPALLGSLTSCKKEPTSPREPVSAAYQVLNAQGQDCAVFALGQAIVLRYEVRNDTDQEIFCTNPVFSYAHFMEVFRDADGQSQLLGTPYSGMRMTYNGYFIVAAHGTLSFTIPWVASAQYPDEYPFNAHATTTPLPAGRYHTSVQPQLSWCHGGEAAVTVPLATQDFSRTFEVR